VSQDLKEVCPEMATGRASLVKEHQGQRSGGRAVRQEQRRGGGEEVRGKTV
jgi:hypothetical protein